MNPSSNVFVRVAQWAVGLLDKTQGLSFLAPALMRAYLAPIFFMAGLQKLQNFGDIVEWFGSVDGLHLPFPTLMAALATGAELGGALSLALGLGLRFMCVPMIVTMLVAISSVHWSNGWLAIAEGMGPFATARTMEATGKLAMIKEILMQHGNYDELTANGPVVILNNGIEFAATYFVMLLSLLFTGAGKFLSVDYWIRRRFMHLNAVVVRN